jgi:hypothetical protein
LDGKFHGKGTYYFADSGKIYKGNFVENHIHGKGIMKFPDGKLYNGDFKQDKMDGLGVMQTASKDRYIGAFKDDKKEGNGVWLDYATKTKRQGTWVNDKRTAWIGPEIQTQVTEQGELDDDGEFIYKDMDND